MTNVQGNWAAARNLQLKTTAGRRLQLTDLLAGRLMAKPSYPKEMRERAKHDKRSLVTVDVPGMCFQGPVDPKTINELIVWVTENIFKKQVK